MVRLLLITFFFFGINTVQSQPVNVKIHFIKEINTSKSDTIYYWPQQKLTWSDFQGVPPAKHFGGAITASGIEYSSEMHYDEDGINIDLFIKCYFSKSNSWKKPDINSAYHLEHEQHHFDITYLAAINLVNDFKKAKYTAQNWSQLLTDIYNKNMEQLDERQKRYDTETRNSIATEKQLEWNKKITDELATLTVDNP